MRQQLSNRGPARRQQGESIADYIRRVVDSRDSDPVEVARAVVLSPELESRVLRAANSPHRGRIVQVRTIQEAIVDLGLAGIRQLVLRHAPAAS